MGKYPRDFLKLIVGIVRSNTGHDNITLWSQADLHCGQQNTLWSHVPIGIYIVVADGFTLWSQVRFYIVVADKFTLWSPTKYGFVFLPLKKIIIKFCILGLTLFSWYGTHARPHVYLKEQKKTLINFILGLAIIFRYAIINLEIKRRGLQTNKKK